METNYIIVRLLDELLKAGGSIPTERLMQHLELTRRTLQYNLGKLNDDLRELGFPQAALTDDRLLLDVSREGEIRAALLECDRPDPSYILSQDERKTLILLAVGLAREDVSLAFLTDVLQVSKNTVMTSLNQLRGDLKKLGVSVVAMQKSGYALRAGEFVIRCLLYEHLIQPQTRQMRACVDQLLLTSIRGENAAPEEKEQLFSAVASGVRSASAETGLDLSYDSVQELSCAVLMILCRTGRGEIRIDDRDLAESAEYRASGLIAEALARAGIDFPAAEKYFLTAVLMSAKKYDSFYLTQGQHTVLDDFIDELIDSFELCACLALADKKELKRKLMLHIRPMYYRIKYHIKSDVRYAYNIQREYPDIFRYTQTAVRVSESILGVFIPDEDVAFLCVYFVSWLVNHSTETVPKSGNILIVCGAGVGTSLFVHHQITEILGREYQIDIQDLGGFVPADITKYDLVLSTVPLPIQAPNVIAVSPMLSERDKEMLLNWHFSERQIHSMPYLDELLALISESAIITDRPQLISSLRKYLSENFAHSLRPGLRDVLTPAGVRIHEGAYDRKTAVALAVQPLVESGAAAPGYGEAILDAMGENGIYPLLAPGILLAHAKPDASVRRVGLTVSVFRRGVALSERQAPVHTVFTLCTPDNAAHTCVIRDLTRLLGDRDLLRRLQQADFADETALWRKLTREE